MRMKLKTMKTKIFLFNLIISVSIFSSCQKDTDIFIPTTTVGVDTNWVSTITDQSPISQLNVLLKRNNSVDSIDASAGATIVTAEGVTVIVQPQSLLLTNGQTATGKIYAETMLINKRGDMVNMDKPTTSNGRLLISGGEVFVRLRKDNEDLHLAPGKRVYVKFSDPSPSSLMKIFYGDESNPQKFNWLADSSTASSIGITSQPMGYEFAINNLRWINCDYFADTSSARVSVVASLPSDYTNANTKVYLVFKDFRAVMGMYGDVNSKKFASLKVLSGKSAAIVSITKKGNNSYYLGHETINTGQINLNGIQTIPLTPQPTSLNDIKAYLTTL